MRIEKLFNDIFERVDYLDTNIKNPFLEKNCNSNPFARFYTGTYVWIEKNDNDE